MGEDSPNGDGSMRRYFRGDGDEVDTGTHLRRFGDAGLISGSKSILRFRVAPHAMALRLSFGVLFKIKDATCGDKKPTRCIVGYLIKAAEGDALLTKVGA